MGLHGGKWVWVNPANNVTYSEDVFDTTDSKVTAAEARAATALGIAASALRMKNNGRGADPRRGNTSTNN